MLVETAGDDSSSDQLAAVTRRGFTNTETVDAEIGTKYGAESCLSWNSAAAMPTTKIDARNQEKQTHQK